jgi:hypothetical protein
MSFGAIDLPKLSNKPTMEDQNQQQINIELPEDIAEGTYSNLAIISHSHSEFVVDFVCMLPNVPRAKVKSRIILTPEHAKRLLGALNDNIKRFEQQFGTINNNEQPPFPPMNFSTPKAQA